MRCIIYHRDTRRIVGVGASFPDALRDALPRVDAEDAYQVERAHAHDAGRWSALAGVGGRLHRNPWRWVLADDSLTINQTSWDIVDGAARPC